MKMKIEEMKKILDKVYNELYNVFEVERYFDDNYLNQKENETNEEYYDRIKKELVEILITIKENYERVGLPPHWSTEILDKLE